MTAATSATPCASTSDSANEPNFMCRFRSARYWVANPLIRKVSESAWAIGVRSGSPKNAAINPAEQKTINDRVAPIPVFSQNRFVRWAFDKVSACTAAVDKPKSRKISPIPTNDSTIATSP